MSKLQELVAELKTNKVTFSRNDFDKIALALINEVEYSTESCKTKNGEMVSETIMPVKEFRKGIREILIKFGVDKQDAEKVMGSDFKIAKADWFYPIISEMITNYMATGHKFSFITKEDFMGSIFMKDVEEKEKEFTNPQTKEKFKKKVPKHKALFKQSSVPSWKAKKKK